jgi:hypothetical protein
MLSELYNNDEIARLLLGRADWRPYATAAERNPWEGLPASVRDRHIAAGEARLDFAWPALPATVFLDFARNGDRDRFQRLSFVRRHALADLVLAECVEGRGRFVDAIVDGIWAICEETYWGVPAHVGVQAAGVGLPDVAEPTVDLFVAETASHLAWALYLLGERFDEVSPLLRQRILYEQRRRLLHPCLQREDFGWMGLGSAGQRRVNNWNPWICSNWLTTALLLEEDEVLRRAHVVKVLRCLDRFLDPYPRDGGCDEGPSYWGRAGASLFDCLDLLRSSTGGGIDLFADPLVANIGRFLHRVHIDEDYYVNFADAPAMVYPDAALVFRYGQAIDDADMTAMGAWLSLRENARGKGTDSTGRTLRTMFSAADLAVASVDGVSGHAPLPRDVWLPQIEVMAARDTAGSAQGFFVAAKGGHNAESHNHNDIGHFVLYVDGLPILVDAGVETYTRKTFGPERYDIWTMQSAYHNLPTIGAVQQLPGAQYAARSVTHRADSDVAELSLDIAGAYPVGVLASWRRQIRLDRGMALTVCDAFELGAQAAGPLAFSLITACEPHEVTTPATGEGDGTLRLAPGAAPALQLLWQIPGATLAVDTLELTDARLRRIWGDVLYRLHFTVAQPPRSGQWQFRFERVTT